MVAIATNCFCKYQSTEAEVMIIYGISVFWIYDPRKLQIFADFSEHLQISTNTVKISLIYIFL